MGEGELIGLFKRFGAVNQLVRGRLGQARDEVLVVFAAIQDAGQCYEFMNAKPINHRGPVLEMQFCEFVPGEDG